MNVAKDYNSNMNGVDLTDQLRSVYNCRIRSRKWWVPLFFWLLETAIVNSYLCYKFYFKKLHPDKDPPLSHSKFRSTLAHSLSPPTMEKRRRRTTQVTPTPTTRRQGSHWPSRIGNTESGRPIERYCVYCKEKNEESNSLHLLSLFHCTSHRMF